VERKLLTLLEYLSSLVERKLLTLLEYLSSLVERKLLTLLEYLSSLQLIVGFVLLYIKFSL
jgi:hypothetical protein